MALPRTVEFKPGVCAYCGRPIVRHGEIVPAYLHGACAHALQAVPEDEREALVEGLQREREQARQQKQAGERAEQSVAPMLPF